jgi:hypothetical protein
MQSHLLTPGQISKWYLEVFGLKAYRDLELQGGVTTALLIRQRSWTSLHLLGPFLTLRIGVLYGLEHSISSPCLFKSLIMGISPSLTSGFKGYWL